MDVALNSNERVPEVTSDEAYTLTVNARALVRLAALAASHFRDYAQADPSRLDDIARTLEEVEKMLDQLYRYHE